MKCVKNKNRICEYLRQSGYKKIIQFVFIILLCFPVFVFADDVSDIPDSWKPSETANPTYDAQFEAYKKEESWKCSDSKCTNYAGVKKTEDELEKMYQSDMAYRAWRSENKWKCKDGTCTNENGEKKSKDELKTVYESSTKTPKEKPKLDVDFSNGCSILGEDLLSLLADVFHWIRGGCIALVVILGILDFIKATASNDADALKKSGSKFVKRVIVLALLIILPTLIEFILRLIGFTSAAVCFEKF